MTSDLFGFPVDYRGSRLKGESRAAAAARVAAFRKTPEFRQWYLLDRERRLKRKEKYRRMKGAKSRLEINQQAVAKRKKRAMERLHDGHVTLWRRINKVVLRRSYQRAKYHGNPTYAVYHRLKRWMQKHLQDGRPSRKWSAMLGYTPEQLKNHIERQFLPGMGWHNKGQWHIDHIIPVSSFSISSIESREFRECFGLSNLRPIWAKDNQRKGAKKVTLL